MPAQNRREPFYFSNRYARIRFNKRAAYLTLEYQFNLMSYLIYARKYRPTTFEAMIGQSHVIKTLQNAIRTNRVAQAYIFSGMRGIGKTTAARILAKALNCLSQDQPTPTPCNQCESCLAINEDRSIDVIEIDGASNRGIADIQSIRESVKYKPIHSRYKVIIIDEVHQVTGPGFNALLKTLEEPPPRTVFIFATTEIQKVPATIVSRCQHFEFKKITHRDLINHLLFIAGKENITISDFGLNLIADAAGGSVRDAQSLLDQAVAFSGDSISDDDLKEILGTINRDLLFKAAEAVLQEDPGSVFSLVEKIIEKGYDLRYFFSELIQHFSRMLITKSTKDPGELIPLDKKDLEQYAKSIEGFSSEDILRYLIALQQAEPGLRYSSHPRIFLESTLIKLCYYRKLVSLEEVIQRIEEMRKAAGGSTPAQKIQAPGYAEKPAAFRSHKNLVNNELKGTLKTKNQFLLALIQNGAIQQK